MKIVFANFPGSAGKTTLAVNCAKPRMPGAEFIAVESINETAEAHGVEVRRISGERFRELFLRLLKTDHAIVDVGSSNVEDFLDGMAKYSGSQLEFDYFVLPVTSGAKEQAETVTMYQTLLKYSIDPSRIKILCNKVERGVAEDFDILMKYKKHDSKFPLNEAAAVMENDLFNLMGQKSTSIEAILADQTDFRAKIRELGPDADAKTLNSLADSYTMRSLALTVHKNLDDVFTALFGVTA